jgi:hypothetical protein
LLHRPLEGMGEKFRESRQKEYGHTPQILFPKNGCSIIEKRSLRGSVKGTNSVSKSNV